LIPRDLSAAFPLRNDSHTICPFAIIACRAFRLFATVTCRAAR
jgi:hypothetical protein